MKNKARALHVFARNPKLKELFITEDGQVFTDEQAANSQNTRYGKPEATKLTRDQFPELKIKDEEAKAEAKAKQEAEKKAAEEAAELAKQEAEKKAAEEAAELAKQEASEGSKNKSGKDIKSIEVSGAKEVKSNKTKS
jgi:membrane protein involved in colicin uptake